MSRRFGYIQDSLAALANPAEAPQFSFAMDRSPFHSDKATFDDEVREIQRCSRLRKDNEKLGDFPKFGAGFVNQILEVSIDIASVFAVHLEKRNEQLLLGVLEEQSGNLRLWKIGNRLDFSDGQLQFERLLSKSENLQQEVYIVLDSVLDAITGMSGHLRTAGLLTSDHKTILYTLRTHTARVAPVVLKFRLWDDIDSHDDGLENCVNALEAACQDLKNLTPQIMNFEEYASATDFESSVELEASEDPPPASPVTVHVLESSSFEEYASATDFECSIESEASDDPTPVPPLTDNVLESSSLFVPRRLSSDKPTDTGPTAWEEDFKDEIARYSYFERTTSRPHLVFDCTFKFAGCDNTFVRKMEWKRHVYSQHLLLDFWQCDHISCRLITPKFNTEDLFMSHLIQKHSPASVRPISRGKTWETLTQEQKVEAERESSARYEFKGEDVPVILERCKLHHRDPPARSVCGFCGVLFKGVEEWDQRMEHVGRHYEDAHKKGITLPAWSEDIDLIHWSIGCGMVEKIGSIGFQLIATGLDQLMIEGASTDSKSDEEC